MANSDRDMVGELKQSLALQADEVWIADDYMVEDFNTE
jgi:adenosyl cobinamide kinase/adenosyl cobinamide phosphate guanylyltransferase